MFEGQLENVVCMVGEPIDESEDAARDNVGTLRKTGLFPPDPGDSQPDDAAARFPGTVELATTGEEVRNPIPIRRIDHHGHSKRLLKRVKFSRNRNVSKTKWLSWSTAFQGT
ncbi:MAG: hypothetical protein AMXMBFR4_09110 [Candidatus Hydrogenedentota bacterium]